MSVTTTNYLDQVAGLTTEIEPPIEPPSVARQPSVPAPAPAIDTSTITKLIEVSLAQQQTIDSLTARLDQFETEPPTLHLARPTEPQSDLAAWLAMGVIVITMAGVASFAFSRSPSITTQHTVTGQQQVITSQAELLNQLAREASRPRQCKALCF